MDIQLNVIDLWKNIPDDDEKLTFSHVGFYRVVPILERREEDGESGTFTMDLPSGWSLLELIRNNGSGASFWIVAWNDKMQHGAATQESALEYIRNVERAGMYMQMINNANIETADGEAAARFADLLGGVSTGRTNTKDGGPIANRPRGRDLTE